MAPDLVVANAAFTTYPGGVIAIRCTDWLGAARGTLTTETDARAVTGEVVRDTQTVATSIRTNEIGAYQEADDTLEIDFSLLPIEGAATNGMPYQMLLSFLIEGDWDITNTDTLRLSTQQEFAFGCRVGFHGVPGSVLDSDPEFAAYYPRIRPHYVIVSCSEMGDLVGDEVLHVRAFAQAGTTIEILLDQIYLVPYVSFGTKLGQWENSDFALVGGQHNTFGAIGYDPPETGTGFVDGADGGDTNGKFTWMPLPEELNTLITGADGGGDYQKDPDNEYMARVVTDDFYWIQNSVTGSEASVHAYSLHGSNYRDDGWWLEDDFTRTEASGWGVSPQGFGWWGSGSPDCTVNGSQALMSLGDPGGTAFAQAFPHRSVVVSTQPLAAEIDPGQGFIFTGTFEYSAIPTDTGVGSEFDAYVNFLLVDVGDNSIGLFFLPTNLGSSYPAGPSWFLTQESPETGTPFFGPVDTSSWFVAGSPVGFRIEIKRYRLRVRIWDASGAEPGTWDYDDYPPWNGAAYPYGDDLDISTAWGGLWEIYLEGFGTEATFHTVAWDDFQIGYDPYGTPGDMTAIMEQPHGTQVGEIDIPYGAWQMVYWGTRDWTELDFGDPYLSFSSKVWNESGSAELQRAEAPFWYFRSVHGGLVPMNWRSSERPGSVRRVLVGDR